MSREAHVRICEGLGGDSPGLLDCLPSGCYLFPVFIPSYLSGRLDGMIFGFWLSLKIA